MATTLTSKGQVTIPKRIRDAMNLVPGSSVEFTVSKAGDVVLQKAGTSAGTRAGHRRDRFEAARGKADVPWRTDALMSLLRGND